VAPGKVGEKRAHPGGGSTGRWRSELSPTVFGGVGVAAVADGMVQQLQGVGGDDMTRSSAEEELGRAELTWGRASVGVAASKPVRAAAVRSPAWVKGLRWG
jgi:hypothetical protein